MWFYERATIYHNIKISSAQEIFMLRFHDEYKKKTYQHN